VTCPRLLIWSLSSLPRWTQCETLMPTPGFSRRKELGPRFRFQARQGKHFRQECPSVLSSSSCCCLLLQLSSSLLHSNNKPQPLRVNVHQTSPIITLLSVNFSTTLHFDIRSSLSDALDNFQALVVTVVTRSIRA